MRTKVGLWPMPGAGEQEAASPRPLRLHILPSRRPCHCEPLDERRPASLLHDLPASAPSRLAAVRREHARFTCGTCLCVGPADGKEGGEGGEGGDSQPKPDRAAKAREAKARKKRLMEQGERGIAVHQ